MADNTQVPQSFFDQANSIQEQINKVSTTLKGATGVDKSGNIIINQNALGGGSTPVIPPTGAPPNLGDNISNASAVALAWAESQQKQFEAQQAQLQQAQQQQQQFQQQATDFMANRTNTVTATNNLLSQYNVPQNWEQLQNLTPQIDALNKQLADLQNQELKETDTIQNNPQYSVQYASREANRVAHEYAIRKSGVSAELGVKVALMNALQGNIQTATGLVKDIVANMQYEDNLTLTSINSFMDNNQNFISSLTSSQQTLMNNISDYWNNKVAQDKDDYTAKTDLVVKYGLNLTAEDIKNMSYEEIAAMAAQESERRQLVSEKEKGGGINPSSGFASYDVETDFRDYATEAVWPQITAGKMTLDQAFKALRNRYSPNEVSDQAIKEYLGMDNEKVKPLEETKTPTYEGPTIPSSTAGSTTAVAGQGGNANAIYNYLWGFGIK